MGGESVTRKRPSTTTDTYGNTVRGTATTDVVIEGCFFAPAPRPEAHGDMRSAVIETATLYAPDGADIVAGDQIVARAVTYEVDSAAAEWQDGYGGLAGIEVTLRRVSG